MSPNSACFTLQGLRRGFAMSLPIGISVFAYGMVFGVLAKQAGLTLAQAGGMSLLVFAGASQFIALDMWAPALPVATIVITVFIVNLRHMLMGAALYPWHRHLPVHQRYLSSFFITDENWALTMKELQHGENDVALLVGSGLMLYLCWSGSTISGYLFGHLIEDPVSVGLDFVFLAVFVAMLTGMWKGKSDWLPWAVSAVVAALCAQWLPGKWYILAGGIAGSVAGLLQDE